MQNKTNNSTLDELTASLIQVNSECSFRSYSVHWLHPFQIQS